MTVIQRVLHVLALCAFAALAACGGTYFEDPDMQGPPAMVRDSGTPRLWVLTKQEEVRESRLGRGRNSTSRSDTYFHFDVQAFDPVSARPLWKSRIVTYGDPNPGVVTSRVVGSSVAARLLGQDGALVWLLVDATPYALDAATGQVLIDGAGLQERRPELAGMLPGDATRYGFDQGLVITTADARVVSVRGPSFEIADYTPPPPATEAVPLKANGMPKIVPMRPFGPLHVRHLRRGDEWIGLYSPKEAEDAANDAFGDHLLYPYSVLDEGQVRRQFWRGTLAEVQQFDERFTRIAALAPIDGTPTFLRGRFVRDPRGDDAFIPEDGGSVVWHLTRIDSAGRLALTRLDDALQPRWTTELPLSESGTVNPVSVWILPDRIVAMGDLQFEDDALVRHTQPHLVSVALGDGARAAWNLTLGEPVPELEAR